MTKFVAADGAILEQVLDDTYPIWGDGLSRAAYGKFYAAQLGTAWGRRNLRRFALTDGDQPLASAKLYRFDAVLDAAPLQIAGIGAVFTSPASRGRGAARELIERTLEQAAADGADLALLFSEIGPLYYERLGFKTIPLMERRLRVTESTRYGAPATMIRGGDDRDLNDIVALGATRAAPFRFHLVRDRDAVQFAIARKRLQAGLGSAGARELNFFIAEEGASAVAYVVISVHRGEWTIEEAGDRDPGGARLGAILQALIAREPAEVRPAISVWLPAGFVPPQVTIVDESPAKEVMMIRPLSDRGREAAASPLTAADVFYWHGDAF